MKTSPGWFLFFMQSALLDRIYPPLRGVGVNWGQDDTLKWTFFVESPLSSEEEDEVSLADTEILCSLDFDRGERTDFKIEEVPLSQPLPDQKIWMFLRQEQKQKMRFSAHDRHRAYKSVIQQIPIEAEIQLAFSFALLERVSKELYLVSVHVEDKCIQWFASYLGGATPSHREDLSQVNAEVQEMLPGYNINLTILPFARKNKPSTPGTTIMRREAWDFGGGRQRQWLHIPDTTSGEQQVEPEPVLQKEPTRHHGQQWGLEKSSFTHPDPQALVNRCQRTGVPRSGTPGRPGFSARIDFGEVIGCTRQKVVTADGSRVFFENGPTTWGLLQYGELGVHIIPAAP